MQDHASARCPDENTLLALLEGELARERFVALERHVAACPTCGGLVAELALSRAAMQPSTREDHAQRRAERMTDDDDKRARSTETTPGGDDDAAGAILSVRGPAAYEELTSVAKLRTVDPARYEVGAEIARGGMGRVMEAWDSEQRRRVAIKVLLRSGDEAARRFVREARITARLQHPAIVPLYEAGRWSTGEPFFAMKLVAGRSLDDAVARARTLDEKLALLPHLVAVTEALAYAHEEGIVHRDLKPSNVLVGRFGETVVIDWGLAKDVRDDDDDGPPPSGPYRDSERSPKLTAIGQALGTPCYMAPEQARGESVDARADVYALGAMLYHALAGAPPHVGGGAKATIARVLAGPPAPLASRAPGTPGDLITIVEKAMARTPSERYPDARAMAADLRRFTAGQLVDAHEYSLLALLRRWVARHRAVVATACVLLAALTASSVFSVRRIVRERDRADALSVTAVTQRDAAERLAGFVLGRLRERLEAFGKLDLLGGVGAEVDGYYRTLDPTRDAGNAAVLVRRGRALFVLVEVERRTRDWPAAIALARSAIDAFQLAAQRDPNDAEAGALLVVARASLAGVLENAGRTDEGLAEGARAMDAASALVARAPADDRVRVAAAFADSRGAFLRASHSDVEGGRSAALRARAHVEGVSGAARLDAFWQDTLGSAYRNLGGFDTRAQDWPATAEVCRAAIDLRRAQLRVEPDHVERTSALAYMLRGLAFAANKLGHEDDALAALRESVKLRAWLLEREPNDATARYDQGIALAMTCEMERAWHGPTAQAKSDCDAARSLLAALVAARPDDAKAEDALGRALRSVGRTSLAAGDREAAWRAFDEAVRRASHAAASDPASFALESGVIEGVDGRARAALALDRVDAARADAADAVARVRQQVQAHPKMKQFELDLALRLVTEGEVARAAGDPAGARRAYAEALEHSERAVAATPEDVESTIVLAIVCSRLARAATAAEGARLRERAAALLAPLAHRVSPEDRARVDGR